MPEHVLPNTGEYADIALGVDGVVMCAETAGRDAIHVYRGTQGDIIETLPGALNDGRYMALYPRIAVNEAGMIAVTYQFGTQIAIVLLNCAADIRPVGEVPFGAEMVGIAWIPADVQWQASYIVQIAGAVTLVTRRYDALTGEEIHVSHQPTDTTQGISRILSDGTVVTVDQDFIWGEYPGISRPWQSGPFVVGQGNDAPARAVGYLGGDVEMPYRIFDGLAFRPRAVQPSPGTWTTICTGQYGTRVVNLPPFVPDQPTEPPVEPPIEPPEPPEPPMPKPYDEQFYLQTAPPLTPIDPFGATAQAIADYAVMGRPVDGQYAIWFTRTEHDYQNGMTLPASWKKHRNELRALLDPSGTQLPPFL